MPFGMANAAFIDASLVHTLLSNADLTGTKPGRSSIVLRPERDRPLPGTHLDGADLTHAEVTAALLAGAYLTDTTRLPLNLAEDPWVQARIKACQQWAAALEAEHRSIRLDLGGLEPTPDPSASPQEESAVPPPS